MDATVIGAIIGAAGAVGAAMVGGRSALRVRQEPRSRESARVRVAPSTPTATADSRTAAPQDPATITLTKVPPTDRYGGLRGEQLTAAFLADVQLDSRPGDNVVFNDVDEV